MSKPFHIYLYGERRGPIAISFERLSAQLADLKRMFFELDGSFVWTGQVGAMRWQIDGMVYDAAGVIQYIDIKGECPWEYWVQLLQILADGGQWSSEWTVLRLPDQTAQTLKDFNQDIWRSK